MTSTPSPGQQAATAKPAAAPDEAALSPGSTPDAGTSPPSPGSTPDAGTSPASPGPASPGLPVPSRRAGAPPAQRLITLGLIAVFLLAVVVMAAYFALRPRGTSLPRPSGIPADVPSSLINLMFLSPVPHPPAPGFTLTDQTGRTMALSALRGKVVVLEFMDPHCVDICPIVSQEFVDAYHDLGPLASKVAFVAVNVNQYHATVADVAAFSREHGLTTIPGWHFFTGQVPALQAVWRAYHIAVQAPSPKADIVHTSAVYFIDPQGREAFLASPMADHTSKGAAFLPAAQLSAWGRGIALVARDLAG